MATAKPIFLSQPPRLRGGRWLLLMALLLGAGLVYFGPTVRGTTLLAAARAARETCSCRYIGGRDLAACRADLGPGFRFVDVRENAGEQRITARVPLVSAQSASYRAGEGCVLEPWQP